MLKGVRAVVSLGLYVSLALTVSAFGGGGGSAVSAGKASDAQIVFEAPVRTAAGSAEEIFTMNLDGSNRTQITHDGLNKFLPHFSPDGTRLVYTKFLVGGYGQPNSQFDVVVYDFASAKETQLTHTGTGFQPVWSPDGQRIAFDTAGGPMWIMNADGSNSHLLGAPSNTVGGDIAWSSDDWILFTPIPDPNSSCFKVRLDKIRPDGSARTQVTDGGPNCTPNGMEQSGDADPGFSADGKTIYSSRGFPLAPPGFPGQTVRRLYAFSSDAWTPGKIETDLSLPTAPNCIEGVPKGSPDGTRVLLFRACAGEAHTGVFLTDTAGSYRTWIANGFGPDWNPVAVPTGTVRNGRVACFGDDATGTSQIFTFAADGSDKKQLTTQGQNDYPSWTRDGAHILFSSGRTRGLSTEIWIMDPDGSNPKRITSGTPTGGEITPFASPDGKQVAFTRYGPVVGRPEIWVINVDGTNLRQLTTTSFPATGPITGSVHPTWSADGKKITYASSQSGSIQIWQMNADGSNQVQMTTGNGENYPDSNVPDWSLDGKKITFWSGFETQYGEVWVMDADGQNKRRVTDTVDPRNSDNPHWSADGTQILFASNLGGSDRVLYVADAAGGAPRLFAKGMLWGTWQPVRVGAPFGVNLDQHGLTGSWYNPATGGQGFEIEVYPNLNGPGQGQLFAGWFTYDVAAAGGRRWYVLSGDVSSANPAATLQIFAVAGGNLNAPPSVGVNGALGQATIQFSDCNTGSLTYHFTDGSGRSGNIPLSRLTPNVTCSPIGDNGNAPSDYLLSGNWYDPNTSGQGLSFDFSPAINNVFAAWYTFKPNGQQIGGPASQDWFTLQSAQFVDGRRPLDNISIIETTGGVFNNPTATVSAQVGTANIVFQSCNAMTLRYTFTRGNNANRSGTINLQRVGPTPTGCSTR